jgi:hypothetical protein
VRDACRRVADEFQRRLDDEGKIDRSGKEVASGAAHQDRR